MFAYDTYRGEVSPWMYSVLMSWYSSIHLTLIDVFPPSFILLILMFVISLGCSPPVNASQNELNDWYMHATRVNMQCSTRILFNNSRISMLHRGISILAFLLQVTTSFKSLLNKMFRMIRRQFYVKLKALQ